MIAVEDTAPLRLEQQSGRHDPFADDAATAPRGSRAAQRVGHQLPRARCRWLAVAENRLAPRGRACTLLARCETRRAGAKTPTPSGMPAYRSPCRGQVLLLRANNGNEHKCFP
jgi:hypothetical protein